MKKQREIERLVAIVFVLSAVLVAFFYCLVQGDWIWNIFLPNGKWSDEVFYYKQIEAMIEYGMPQGYFGYGGTHAEQLTFGAWSVFLLLPYVVMGKFVGWNFSSPIACNLLCITIALFIFYMLVRPSIQSMVIFIAGYSLSPLVVRFTISGMTEAILFAATIVIVALYYKMSKTEELKWLWITYFVVMYFVLCRPYFAVFFLFPLFFHYRRVGCKALISFSLFTGISLVIYFGFVQKLCAPYFTSLIQLDEIIEPFKTSMGSGVLALVNRIFSGIADIGLRVIHIFEGEQIAEYYLYIIIVMFVCLWECIKNKKNTLFWVILLILVMFLAVIMLYSTNVGGRHMLFCYVAGLLFLAMECNAGTVKFFGLCMLAIMIIVPKNGNTYSVPFYSEDVNSEYDSLEDTINLVNDVGWNNTVIWGYDEDFTVLYYLPSGVGINLCFDNIELINSSAKYFLVRNSSNLSQELTQSHAKIWTYNGWELYSTN